MTDNASSDGQQAVEQFSIAQQAAGQQPGGQSAACQSQINQSSLDCAPSDDSVPISATGRPLPKHWLAMIALIWSGQAVSMLTSYAAAFACVWYVTETTGSAAMLSLLSICAYLPMGLLAPYGGVLADRFNRKVVIICSDMSVALFSLLLAVVVYFGYANAWLVALLVLVRAVGQAFHGPAMAAAMPMLVPEKHLLRINMLDMSLISAAGIISPAIGITLYTVFGFHFVMFLDFAGAVVACLALMKAPIPSLERASQPEKHHPLVEMKEGWRALRSNNGLFLFIVLVTLVMVCFGPLGALYPLMTYQHFNGTGYMAALVETVFAAGMLVGSLAVVALGNIKRLVLFMVAASVAFGLFSAAAGALPPTMFAAFVVLCGLMGLVCAWFNGPTVTLVQRVVPEDKMGRVLGFVTAIMGFTSPVGIAIGGFGAEILGVAPVFVIAGLLCAAFGVLCYVPKSIRALDA